MMDVQLPDREEITLCEAVTAFVCGESRDASLGPFYSGFASDALLEQLHNAARAGQIRFRALKIGNSKYQEIDPPYFSTRRYFNWSKNEICSWGPVDEEYNIGEYDEVLGSEWYDVHLDREQFASLLRDMGVLVQQNPDAGVPQNLDTEVPADLSSLETCGTGLAGRPKSVQFVLPMAKRRLDAREYPDSKTEFCNQLARDFAKAAPKAHHPKPNSIRNDAEFTEMWCRKPPKDLSDQKPKIIDRS